MNVKTPDLGARTDFVTSESASELVSDAEREWLVAHPLMPIATYENNTVTVKIFKNSHSDPGRIFGVDAFRDNLLPVDDFKRSSFVETSFDWREDGRLYFFYATRIPLPVVGAKIFVPMILEVTEDWDARDGQVGLCWRRVKTELALEMTASPEFASRLGHTLQAAGVDRTAADYLSEINERISAVEEVRGRKTYDLSTGIYLDTQYVKPAAMPEWLMSFSNWIGADLALGAALKDSYHALDETEIAGPRGRKGRPVEALRDLNSPPRELRPGP